MYNKVVIIGNLVSDPETKTIQNGTPISRLRLAIDDPFRKDNSIFIDVEAWEKMSDFCSQWLKKGRTVIVDGRLCMDSWEKDGQKFSKLYVRAQDIRFCSTGKKEDETETKEKKPTGSNNKESSKAPKNSKSSSYSDVDDSDVPF
jgi:single-strand DNA-binding protein